MHDNGRLHALRGPRAQGLAGDRAEPRPRRRRGRQAQSRARLGPVPRARRARARCAAAAYGRGPRAPTEETDRITHGQTPQDRRGPARAAPQVRLPRRCRQAADEPAAGSARHGREVRRVPRARVHHLLSALVDGGPGRGRRRYFESTMPSPETQPLFDEAKKLGIGFYIGYAELTPRGRGASTPRSWSGPTARSSASTARSICRATPTTSRRRRSSTWRRSTSRSATSASASGASWTRSPAC